MPKTRVAAAAGAFAIALHAAPAAADSLQAAAYAPPASGQNDRVGAVAAPALESQSLVLTMDRLRRVSFSTPVSTVLIGNPAIADVTMVSRNHAVVAPKSVGSTNIFFLDAAGAPLGDFDIVVREGESRRVLLRRGPGSAVNYQCAPRCERTLAQTDSPAAHEALGKVVTRENDLLDSAIDSGQGAQSAAAETN